VKLIHRGPVALASDINSIFRGFVWHLILLMCTGKKESTD